MKSKKTTTTPVVKETIVKKPTSLFDKENKLWMLAGIIIMIIGFLLMAGGRSEDPNVFNANEVYSTTRITIAPILILAGLVVLIFSIFRQPKRR
jgi:predicted ABC-type sugar transport system permease subunit